jgi:hypothetical protein
MRRCPPTYRDVSQPHRLLIWHPGDHFGQTFERRRSDVIFAPRILLYLPLAIADDAIPDGVETRIAFLRTDLRGCCNDVSDWQWLGWDVC